MRPYARPDKQHLQQLVMIDMLAAHLSTHFLLLFLLLLFFFDFVNK
jgi:hypothetical protein